LEGYNIMSNLARNDLAELHRLIDQLRERFLDAPTIAARIANASDQLGQLHEFNQGRESHHTPPDGPNDRLRDFNDRTQRLLDDGWAEELADREFRSRALRLMIGSSCPFGTIDDGCSPTGPFGTPPVTHCTGCARPYRAGTLTLTPAGGAVSPFCPDCL
jgi:hypothetical protein